MLTPDETAIWLGISRQTLAKWRTLGEGPPYVKFGAGTGRIRYRRVTLDAWVRANERQSTRDAVVDDPQPA